ncbi:MAG: DNA/RNA nuclease SfsA [Gammaproteobacteria bacterium]
MNFDPPLLQGHFQRRYKRFFADVILDTGELVVSHCPNTGSMKNCLLENGLCWLSESDNPKRKLRYTLEAVTAKYGGMAGVNTGRTNRLVGEALQNGIIAELSGYTLIEPEFRFGEEGSRLDFRLGMDDSREPQKNCLVEVKNLTLGYAGGLGAFPDAVTSRGTRHLRELLVARQQGYRAVLFFCVQHTAIDHVTVAGDIDPLYASTLREVVDAGVEVLVYSVRMSRTEFAVDQAIPFAF